MRTFLKRAAYILFNNVQLTLDAVFVDKKRKDIVLPQ